VGGFELLGSALAAVADAVTSPTAYAVGAWVIALVLAWSGGAKLRAPAAAASALVEFGLAARARPRLGTALGFAELAVAALVAASTLASGLLQTVAPAVAIALFGAFVFLVARSLRAGERFACHCFGAGGGEISVWTLLRAAALAAVSALLLVAGLSHEATLGVGSLALSVVTAAAVVLGTALAGNVARLLRWGSDPFDVAGRRFERRVA
jgi:hypothetical protein